MYGRHGHGMIAVLLQASDQRMNNAIPSIYRQLALDSAVLRREAEIEKLRII